VKARFIEPMLLLKQERLPEGRGWDYQLKLDGYRAIAFKSGGRVHLRSRNDKDFNVRYPDVVHGLARLPDDTIIDGEIVALDEAGRPSFSALQNYAPAGSIKGGPADRAVPVVYYVFDTMMIAGTDLRYESLTRRRTILEKKILPKLREPVRYAAPLDAALSDLIHAVKSQGFEGLVAKRSDSRYEPGLRSGAWMKMRVNRGQEFVIGGYTIGAATFDALVFGYYDGDQLIYAARTRNGFTPASRAALMKKFKGLEIATCPFVNLPEKTGGRWGQGLTKEKMAKCRWLKPVLVGQFEFLEWTGEHHLRHSKFIGLRDDKSARSVVREPGPAENESDA
jgi:DNA ligase D-like protein (predicted ligase)